MDEVDAALLAELQADARLTNRELAERVGVAASTALERVRSLRTRGVLHGYHADVDLPALGRSVQALIAVRIRPPARRRIEAFRDFAAGLPEIFAVFVVSGGEDFLLHVAVPDTDALYAFVIDRLTERPEVADSAPPSSTSTCAGRCLNPSPPHGTAPPRASPSHAGSRPARAHTCRPVRRPRAGTPPRPRKSCAMFPQGDPPTDKIMPARRHHRPGRIAPREPRHLPLQVTCEVVPVGPSAAASRSGT